MSSSVEFTRSELVESIVRAARVIEKHRYCHCAVCEGMKQSIVVRAEWLRDGKFVEDRR